MIVIFNTNGSIYDAEMADYVQQGSNGANRLQVAYVDSARSGLSAYLVAERPNGTTITLPAHKASFDCNGERYQGWEVTITGSFTLYAGVVHCTLNIVDEDDQIQANYPFDVTVNATGNPLDEDWDERINAAQYNAFMAMLSGKATINRVESKDELPVPGQRSVLWLVGTDKYDAYAWDPESEEYRTILNGIYVVGNIATDDISGLPDGQLIYDESTSAYYEKTDVSPYYAKALGGAGVLGAPHILCRSGDSARTIAELHAIYGDSAYIVLRYLDKDYLYFSKKVGSTYTCVAFDTEEQRFYKASGLSGSALPSAMLVPANKIEIASKAFLVSNYVPYSGANSDVHLNGHYLYGAKVYTDHNGENHDSFKAALEEEGISNVAFVLKQSTEIYDDKIDDFMYDYFLNENATLIYRGLNYRKLKETPTDLYYACLNGSITPQTDGTSVNLGRVVKISKTSVDGVHTYTEGDLEIDLYSKDQAKAKFGTSLALELNNTNYKLVAKLYNANGGLIDTSNEIDLPLESIVSSATYYDTYTYEGTTYTKVIVITLSTTSVPTIVPVGDLISGLEKEACVEISSSSGTLTEGQMQTLALDNASIKFNGRIFHKVTNTFFNSVEVIAEQEQGQYINFVVENRISITLSTRAYQYSTKSIQVYNKDEIDDIVQGLQDDIDANADDIADIQGDLETIDERLDNHDTEIAKLKKDVDYAMKYPLLYGTPTTDTEEEVGLTTSQFPATTLPKGLINYVGGMSQKVNQLANWTNKWNTHYHTDTGNIVIEDYHSNFNADSFKITESKTNHKYFIDVRSDTNYIKLFNYYRNIDVATSNTPTIYTENNGYSISLGYTNEISAGTHSLSIIFADLTEIYGAGNEPTSTSDPRIQWLIHYLTDNPQYDEGSIVNAPVENIVSKGFNIWDEEWENGVYSYFDGGKSANPNYLRNKSPIPVFPDTDYYFKNSGNDYMVLFYTKDNDYIGYVSSNSFETPSNCRYVCFCVNNSTYNHDICINLSGSMNGTYLPYQAPSEYPIPSEVQALDGYGLGIDDTLYNYIDFERKKFVKKVAMVDLGTLDWAYDTINHRYYTDGLTSAKLPDNTNLSANILCQKYVALPYGSVNGSVNDNSVGGAVIGGVGYIDIADESFGGVLEDFVASLNGVYLVYELAEPVETDISEYLDRDFPNENLIDTYQGGEVEFENENDMGVPYSLTYQYKIE